MKEEQSTPGFSFQLSASAPPAEVVSQEPRQEGLDPLEPSWFALSDPTLELDLPTRTPAPVASLEPAQTLPGDAEPAQTLPGDAEAAQTLPGDAEPAQTPPSEQRASNADGDARPGERPPAPAIKRISFPRTATTVFSDSVSQAPRVRLESTDDETDDETADDAPLDLPLSAPAPSRAARATSTSEPWHRVQRWSLQAARGTARLARAGGRWALATTRATSKRAAEAWARRQERKPKSSELPGPASARPPEATLSGEEVAPIAEETPRPPSVVVERVRPVLPALAALGAAGACYVLVASLVPTPGNTDAPAEDAAAADAPGLASPSLASSVPNDITAAPAPAADVEAAQTEQLPLPEGLSWPGKGLIEVVTGGRELIYVDGVFTGRGPLRLIPVAPGNHEVVLRTESSERKHVVDVAVDRRTRIALGGGDDAAPKRDR